MDAIAAWQNTFDKLSKALDVAAEAQSHRGSTAALLHTTSLAEDIQNVLSVVDRVIAVEESAVHQQQNSAEKSAGAKLLLATVCHQYATLSLVLLCRSVGISHHQVLHDSEGVPPSDVGGAAVLGTLSTPQLARLASDAVERLGSLARQYITSRQRRAGHTPHVFDTLFASSPHVADVRADNVISVHMIVLKQVLIVEANALLWSRHFAGLQQAAVCVPTHTVCEALMQEASHIEPVRLRSSVVASLVCDVLDLEHNGTVSVAAVSLMAPNVSLVKLLEGEAAKQLQWEREEEEKNNIATRRRNAVDAAQRCESCEKLEAELLLARSEIARLRDIVARVGKPQRSRAQAGQPAPQTQPQVFHDPISTHASSRWFDSSAVLHEEEALPGAEQWSSVTQSRLSPRRESQRLIAAACLHPSYPLPNSSDHLYHRPIKRHPETVTAHAVIKASRPPWREALSNILEPLADSSFDITPQQVDHRNRAASQTSRTSPSRGQPNTTRKPRSIYDDDDDMSYL